VTAPTGTGITYSIDGSTYTNTTGIFTNVAAATYSVTVKKCCRMYLCSTGIIYATSNLPTAATLQPTCAVATGTITVSPTGRNHV
jgi:hypothetical protein